MKLVVGLGNSGDKYKKTRHNVGFLFADLLVQKLSLAYSEKPNLFCSLAKGKCVVVKPNTMMNASGLSVRKVVDFYKIPPHELYIAHDDLDLRLGEYKVQFGIGPKVHNGVNSIERSLGQKEFWRIRIGVDNRQIENPISGEVYVLDNFKEDELEVISEVLKKSVNELVAKL